MSALSDQVRRAIRAIQRDPDLDRSATHLQAITTENEEHWRGQPLALSIPNHALREASSIGDLGFWYAIGEAWAQMALAFFPPSPRILDLGCGSGKMARFFVFVPGVRYLGLDVFQPAIFWCNREFARFADRFRFEHLDVVSQLYNPTGATRGVDVRLPVDDATMDVVICGSLFTHLLEPVFRHYLTELRRCLAAQGTALVSLHTEPANGRFDGTEARIDISEAMFAQCCAEAGLRIDARIGNVYGQQVFALRRTDAAAG